MIMSLILDTIYTIKYSILILIFILTLTVIFFAYNHKKFTFLDFNFLFLLFNRFFIKIVHNYIINFII